MSKPLYTEKEQRWLDTYHEKIARIWAIYQEDRASGVYGGMSMKEREELLGKMRDKLYRLMARRASTVSTVSMPAARPKDLDAIDLKEVARLWAKWQGPGGKGGVR